LAKDKGEHESRRILERIGAETEARMPSPGGEEGDWAELWGKRIGRVLSFVLLGIAIVWLYDFLVEMG
jgi:hypothetical protein